MNDKERAYFESNVIQCFKDVLDGIFYDLDLELGDDYMDEYVKRLLAKLKEHNHEPIV